jgi:hypothetical protein
MNDAEVTALLQRLVEDEPPFVTALGPALESAGRRARRRRALRRGLAITVLVVLAGAIVRVIGGVLAAVLRGYPG